jgi:hypothetical protein
MVWLIKAIISPKAVNKKGVKSLFEHRKDIRKDLTPFFYIKAET